jgi:hypothetical protein
MPYPFPDLSSQEFGRLVVIGLKEVGRNNPPDLWLCRCKCGSYLRFLIPGVYLRSSEMWSCGCDSRVNYSNDSQVKVQGGVIHKSVAL